MLAFLMEWRLVIDLYQNIHANPGSTDYFQDGLAIRAAVLSGAIRRAGKSNQLGVLQSNALCRLNLDP